MSKTEFWIYIGTVMLFAMISAVLAAVATVQRAQIRTLQERSPDKADVQPARYDACKNCMRTFHYENVVVPELQSEIDYWKTAFSNEQMCNSLMQKEIAKLRTGVKTYDKRN